MHQRLVMVGWWAALLVEVQGRADDEAKRCLRREMAALELPAKGARR